MSKNWQISKKKKGITRSDKLVQKCNKLQTSEIKTQKCKFE